MATFDVPMVPRDGTLSLQDGSGTPIVCTIIYEDGDFKCSEFSESNYDIEEFRDRGALYNVRKTSQRTLEFEFSCHATDFTDATEKLIRDAVCKQGTFAAGVSTKGSNADVWLLQLTFSVEQSNYGASADSTVVFKHCWCSVSFEEGVPGKFSIKGRAFQFNNTASDVTWS